MGQSFAWGIVAGSSLVLGGVLAIWLPVGRLTTFGFARAFGGSALSA